MLEEYIIEAYQVFTRRVHDLPDFEFKPSERELTQIRNFIKILEKKYTKESIGRTYMFNFFAFSYEYWSDLDHAGKKRIPLNWITGKKMIERWANRLEEDLYHATTYATSIGIYTTSMKTGTEKRSDDVKTLKHHEEVEKKRFHGEDYGFVNCLETTTLYNRSSPLCIRCPFRAKCKDKLKEYYPKIYLARGYLKV